ncbi:MAG: IS66 family transposase [Candidatus Binatia bacterium]
MNDLAPLSLASHPADPDKKVPFAQDVVVLTKQEHIELVWRANWWESLHKRVLKREVELEEELALEKAKVRDLTQRLYGKKSEKRNKREKGTKGDSASTSRPRGQQPGSKGHGRTERPHLPVVGEILDLPEHEKYCQDCGEPHVVLPGTDDSEITEVQVQAYTRQIKRKKYARCRCQGNQGVLTAPPAPRVLNRSPIGVSVWTEVLLDKFLYAQATNRLCTDFGYLGYPLSQGTITDGLKRLAPLLKPLVKAMLDKQLAERLFHADETGWRVFEKIDHKEGYRWYLWLMQSPSVAYYVMAPGRDADVPIEHFRGLADGITEVFLICDRYSAYKKLVKNIPVILLAFCWAHVRRDFIDAARSWPELTDWMFNWVKDIGELYHLNKLRLCHWDRDQPLNKQSAAFNQHQQALLKKLSAMQEQRDACLQQQDLQEVQQSVLTSLKNHWSGLILFTEHPQIAMDNNLAERGVRNPVTARHRFYGSGCVWSAQLAAIMFTLLQTLLLWDINPRHWLRCYLTTCAENGGQAPIDLAPFLPWKMTQKRMQMLSLPTPMSEADDTRFIQDSG